MILIVLTYDQKPESPAGAGWCSPLTEFLGTVFLASEVESGDQKTSY